MLPSLSIVYGTTVLVTGGPVVQVWGWLICSLFTARQQPRGCGSTAGSVVRPRSRALSPQMIVGCAMAEVCSTYPSAGSVYHVRALGQRAGQKVRSIKFV